MDTTRWETEALRPSRSARTGPPKPSASARRASVAPRPGANWVTLREAEAATGIPVNTLRKWVRRADLPSYLESDGDLALRMVDLDAVEQRAALLGRDIAPAPSPPETSDAGSKEVAAITPEPASTPEASTDSADTDAPGTDTMIVPIDAWNKMLAQLGNLHEAGQQLAEARERAAKAETEAAFLRERLAELRTSQSPAAEPDVTTESRPPTHRQPDRQAQDPAAAAPATTTYWRILRASLGRRRTGD